MIDLAAVAARINALPGWTADEIEEGMDVHHVAVTNEETGHEVHIGSDRSVLAVDPYGGDDIMLWLPVLQIVAEAMAHE